MYADLSWYMLVFYSEVLMVLWLRIGGAIGEAGYFGVLIYSIGSCSTNCWRDIKSNECRRASFWKCPYGQPERWTEEWWVIYFEKALQWIYCPLFILTVSYYIQLKLLHFFIMPLIDTTKFLKASCKANTCTFWCYHVFFFLKKFYSRHGAKRTLLNII